MTMSSTGHQVCNGCTPRIPKFERRNRTPTDRTTSPATTPPPAHPREFQRDLIIVSSIVFLDCRDNVEDLTVIIGEWRFSAGNRRDAENLRASAVHIISRWTAGAMIFSC